MTLFAAAWKIGFSDSAKDFLINQMATSALFRGKTFTKTDFHSIPLTPPPPILTRVYINAEYGECVCVAMKKWKGANILYMLSHFAVITATVYNTRLLHN